MGSIKQTRHVIYKFRKSKMVKDASGLYHCPTCGAFKGKSTKTKKDKKKK
nr:MAG TPA: PhnA Zinc-Ribbon [Bacteriophage sp.]